MEILTDVLKVIHILTAIMMAWPFSALVAVNNRARLGPPLGDRADVFVENVIKNRTVPCFVFQITAGISGILLLLFHGANLIELFRNLVLGLKFFYCL